MTELRFALDLYDEDSVQQAIETFSEYARVKLSHDGGTAVIQVTAESVEDERALCGEFDNFVLGATVDGAGAGAL